MTSLPVIIPEGYDIVVSKDDTVHAGDVLAKSSNTPSEVIIHLSKRLKVSPKSLGKMLKKNPGDLVEKGDILAQKEGLFGDTVVSSNVRGTLSKYERNDGTVVIRFLDVKTDETEKEILCPLDGTVTICHNDQIVLETDKNVSFGERGTGQTFRGVLKLSDVKSKDPIAADSITVDVIDSVLFGPAFTREAYAKASAIGVGGIVTLSLDENDISYINDKRLSIPVIQVTDEIGKTISKWKNKEVFVDGMNKAILLLRYEKSTR